MKMAGRIAGHLCTGYKTSNTLGIHHALILWKSNHVGVARHFHLSSGMILARNNHQISNGHHLVSFYMERLPTLPRVTLVSEKKFSVRDSAPHGIENPLSSFSHAQVVSGLDSFFVETSHTIFYSSSGGGEKQRTSFRSAHTGWKSRSSFLSKVP